jgi:hypothetical protein
VAEAAGLLDRTTTRVYQLIDEGKLVEVKKDPRVKGRTIRLVTAASVKRLLAKAIASRAAKKVPA